jgi:adenylate kinase family enzyme
MTKPRVVLLTGSPGSGKSTLGREVSQQLRVPFIARDEIRGGLLFSAGAWGTQLERFPTGDEAVEIFLCTVERLLASEVSCIVEYVVRRNRPQDLDRIMALGNCVVVMTNCLDPMERVRRRNMEDRLAASKAVLDAAGFTSINDHTEAVVARMHEVQTEMRVTFPVPVLEVDTTSRYDPSLEEVLTFITARV